MFTHAGLDTFVAQELSKFTACDARTIPQGHLHHVWLTNEGIKSSTATITWEELRQLIHGISLVAETLADSNMLAEARAKYEAEKKR